jgi:hypothetical protein
MPCRGVFPILGIPSSHLPVDDTHYTPIPYQYIERTQITMSETCRIFPFLVVGYQLIQLRIIHRLDHIMAKELVEVSGSCKGPKSPGNYTVVIQLRIVDVVDVPGLWWGGDRSSARKTRSCVRRRSLSFAEMGPQIFLALTPLILSIKM